MRAEIGSTKRVTARGLGDRAIRPIAAGKAASTSGIPGLSSPEAREVAREEDGPTTTKRSE